GGQFIKKLIRLCRQAKYRQRFQFIPNYNIAVAQALIGGSDIWLNTPQRGYEACGTSGMKACLNGVLQMTTRDGWTNNVEWAKLGWTLDSDRVSEDIYRFFEGNTAQMYYRRNQPGLPTKWVDYMIRSSVLIRKNYSATRMLNQYEAELYL
ncbi:glycogen/starch/alpha-glucan phosphorylase, partial [Patescibacteria group bacterium]|nr:glycogen/starch/alpha-glucan phosphorylase [Patescibacteria group bacterium]